jgi:NodT family efflux transporter outer membrane factor (OMF) lipoprotein
MTAPIQSAPPRADTRPSLILLAATSLAVLAGCAVGPDYKRPEVALPAAFKENPGWKVATPNEQAYRGPWWKLFGDPVLDGLEAQLERSNLTIAQAVANYEEARQVARADRTGYLPTIAATGAAQRARAPVPQGGLTASTFTADLGASWEPDFWGRIRRTVESDVEAAQASAADLAVARLSEQALVAEDYIQLRVADDQIRLLENAVEAYRRTVVITQNKYSVGVAARSDVITAQTQLDSTRAQLIGAGVQRAQYEHAIAVLLGKAPADFAIERRPDLAIATPEIPPQMPSSLLERRPDVAAAERQAAAANARVGIQTAAYYPSFSVTGDAGYEGSPLHSLFTTPFRFWTLGAQATDAILDWGQRRDQVLSAKADGAGRVAAGRGRPVGASHPQDAGQGRAGRGGRGRAGGADRPERVQRRHRGFHYRRHGAGHRAVEQGGGARHHPVRTFGERGAYPGDRGRLDSRGPARPGQGRRALGRKRRRWAAGRVANALPNHRLARRMLDCFLNL